jgi:hypothetical protein
MTFLSLGNIAAGLPRPAPFRMSRHAAAAHQQKRQRDSVLIPHSVRREARNLDSVSLFGLMRRFSACDAAGSVGRARPWCEHAQPSAKRAHVFFMNAMQLGKTSLNVAIFHGSPHQHRHWYLLPRDETR